ncbi:conserved hypothetical protein [Vibrio owensii]|uniref:Phage protein n=1 Tax=Vibrio owensii TaxID=696485 RepID=A0AAU9PZ15_9VIBR|nr:conserved hypothetical protein [Vibrio owensii]
MKNQLIDLNNHLFTQIERLSDEGIKGEKLKEEIDRSKAVASVSNQIIANARLSLDAEIFKYELLGRKANMPEMIGKSDEK